MTTGQPCASAVARAAMRRGYPERIVCLTEETTETLYLLGEAARIVGISGFTVRPPRARRSFARGWLRSKDARFRSLPSGAG